MKKNIIICLCTVSLLMVSCANWLDVKPKTTVAEEEFFSRETGFMEALTGIYIKMGSQSLYGKNLSYGFIDVLAQRYSIPGSTADPNPYKDPLFYTFPSHRTETVTAVVWTKMYNSLANINNLIAWADKNKTVFSTEHYYQIIKGEALGLRAFMHFDLLRMYGPIYASNPEAKRMYYRKTFDRYTAGFTPASQIIDDIIKDLKEAESILTGHDPLLFDFPKTENEELEMQGDNFFIYRHKRMNLYAVKAMLARVYLYAGNKTEAATYAQEVIASQQFKLNADPADPLHSTEIIFSIYIDEFSKLINSEFGITGGFYIDDRNFLYDLFDTDKDGTNDFRIREGVGFDYGATVFSVRKYLQANMWPSTEGTIPLIRLPEMYYILAECSNSYVMSSNYLNLVRSSRGVEDIAFSNEADKLNEIEKEYRKELYGEGQLFFFYKRNAYKTFLHCPVSTMIEKNYMFSWPEDEDLFGVTE